MSTPPEAKVAAIVDGHDIPMDEIVAKSLLLDREFVIDRKIEAFVVHREAKRRGVEAKGAQIDARIAVYGKSIAPSTIEAELKNHHISMADFREMFRVAVERDAITASEIKPTHMVHCRQIFLRCTPDGVPKNVNGAKYTVDEAYTLLTDLGRKISMGADFGALATQYGEAGTVDLGVLYDKATTDVDSAALEAGLSLKNGQVTSLPVRTREGCCLIQAMSTGEEHPKSEDKLYADAAQASRKVQMMFLQPEIIGRLIRGSKITYAQDSDIIAGKLPANAAVIDRHPIPMSEVAKQCVTDYGHTGTNIAIENYVVDEECRRLGIHVADSEVDAKVDSLRKMMAPKPIEDGLAAHHTTMAGLRADLRQLLEREKMVMANVPPTDMVHAQVIFLKSDQTGPQAASYVTADQAHDRLVQLRGQLDKGASFDDLAKQYSQMFTGGDAGILYSGVHDVDTAVLDTALKMKPGDITPAPVQTYGGYFLLKVISTGDKHPSTEDAAYASAISAYKLEQADMIAPKYVADLVAKAKVVRYL